MPFFSVITVTLDNIAGLKATHESLSRQTFQDFEWLVCDGGSGDGSLAFLADTDAQLVSRSDSGIYDGMNKGLEAARGAYVLFLNAGDALAGDDVLQSIREAADDADFIYGDSFEEIAGVRYAKPARSHSRIASGMFTHHQAMLYRRSSLGDMRYNRDYKIAADYDFTAQLLAKSRTVRKIDMPICVFEAGGVSQMQAALGRREQYQIRQDLGLCSRAHNIALTGFQAVMWRFRLAFPALYWRWKSSRNNVFGSAP